MRFVLLVFTLPVICGCWGGTWHKSVDIINENRIEAELERYYEKGKPKDLGFDHPAGLNEKALTVFLKDLNYKRRRLVTEDMILPVISPDVTGKLALSIREGLGQASPAERVRFSVTNRHRKWGFLPKARTSRGVAFVKPAGIFNVAFDIVDQDMNLNSSEQFYRGKWGNPTKNTLSNVELMLPEPASSYIDSDGDKHPLWVTVPVEELSFHPSEKEKQIPEQKQKPVPETKQDKTEEESKPSEPKEGQKKGPLWKLTQEEGKLSGEKAMEILKSLRELRDEGVLTDEEYHQKVDEVLKRY